MHTVEMERWGFYLVYRRCVEKETISSFSFSMTGRYGTKSHFVSRRWLRLLNTDNMCQRGSHFFSRRWLRLLNTDNTLCPNAVFEGFAACEGFTSLRFCRCAFPPFFNESCNSVNTCYLVTETELQLFFIVMINSDGVNNVTG
jgi:hypothetical protein